jgi:signal transduction histidine kinase
VNRLARIVSGMFDLSVGRPSEYKPNYQVGHIVACLEQALHEVAPMLQDRRIDLDVNFMPPAGPLSFDTQQMEQVFLNLLDNSCKFTGRGGSVRVQGYPYFWERRSAANGFTYPADRRRHHGNGEQTPNAYRVDISDTGPGIPPDQLERTFTEFSVYGGGSDRSGAGLGLAISRMFVRQHSGKLWAESQNSQGATFCVVLPHHCEMY